MGGETHYCKGSRNVLFSSQPKNQFYIGRRRNKETRAIEACSAVHDWTSSDSIIFAAKAPDGVTLGQDLIPVEQRGNSEVGMLFVDPMFDMEAMKQKIFRFLPGSPAEKLGIKPLDMSNVGSTLAKIAAAKAEKRCTHRGRDPWQGNRSP
jgi:hypothetical protein